jgi:trypsin-like peptidase
MPHHIEKSTLRILNSNGETVGTGFLVAANLVATCAHVVKDAGNTVDSMAGATIRIKFKGYTENLDALVLPEYWSEIDQYDVAILKIDDVPDSISALRMGPAQKSRLKNELYTYGYAVAADEEGIGGLGTFITLGENEKLFQFRMHEANHGHSGAPIYDEKRGIVIGMVKKGNKEKTHSSEITFGIPAEILWLVCDQIKPFTPAPQSRSSLTEGIHLLPYDYAGRIQNFLTEYLGTREHPEPFGGRENAFKILDSWLESSSQRLLLTGPAGRGKSALLVRWLEHLLTHDDLAIAFVPISIRFRTNLASVFFASLAARLAALHGEEVPSSIETSTEVWRGLVNTYLRKQPNDNQTVLVILDGLDEAGDWEAGVDLFPVALPAGIRVVVSARFLAGDLDEKPWLRHLGWEQTELTEALRLEPLTLAGVADVLHSMGFPLNELSRRVDITSELYRLSAGDPLLIHLYVEDLWRRGKDAVRLQPTDLIHIKPGYEGYFDRWWDDQKKLWGQEAPLLRKQVQLVFDFLCGSMGGLTRDDLKELDTKNVLTTHSIEFAIDTLKRFVIGIADEHRETEIGYVLTHPKLRDYFWNRLTGKEKATLENRFVSWGNRIVQALIDEELDPSNVPSYLLNYYGAHLERSQASPEKFLPFVDSPVWYKAWFSYEGAHGGYLQDVRRVWAVCELHDQKEVRRAGQAPLIVKEIRCALIESSLHSLAANIKPDLLQLLFRNRLWTLSQTLVYVRQMSDAKQQRTSLTNLVPHIHAAELQPFISAARSLLTKSSYAQLLVSLTHRFADIRDDTLSAVSQVSDEQLRFNLLLEFMDYVPDPKLDDILPLVRQISDPELHFELLITLSKRFSLAVDELIVAVSLVSDEQLRFKLMLKAMDYVPDLKLDHILLLVRQISDPGLHIGLLIALSERFSPAVDELIVAASHISDKKVRAGLIQNIVLELSQISENIQSKEISPKLKPFEEFSQWIKLRSEPTPAESLDLKDDVASDSWLLTDLAQVLPETSLIGIVEWMRQNSHKRHYAGALNIIANRIPKKRVRALEAINRIRDEAIQSRILIDLIPTVPYGLLANVLLQTRKVRNLLERSCLLIAIARRAKSVTAEAWAATRSIENAELRESLLKSAFRTSVHPNKKGLQVEIQKQYIDQISDKDNTSLLPLDDLLDALPNERWKTFFREAEDMFDQGTRVLIATALVRYWPQSINTILSTVMNLRDEEVRTIALVNILPKLASDGYDNVLQAARNMVDIGNRISLLVALAMRMPHLFEEALAAFDELEIWKHAWVSRKIDHPDLPPSSANKKLKAASNVDPHTEDAIISMLKNAQSIGDEQECAFYLCAIANQMPELTNQILKAIRTISDQNLRVHLMIALSRRLPASFLSEFLGEIQREPSEKGRAKLLISLAQDCSESLDEVFQAALSIRNDMLRARTLSSLIPILSPKQMLILLNFENQISSVLGRGLVLSNIADHLPRYYLGRVYSKAKEIQDPWTRAIILGHLARRQPKYAEEALAIVQEVPDELMQIRLFRDLAPFIPRAASLALHASYKITDDLERAHILCDLAPYLLKAANKAANVISIVDDEVSHALLLSILVKQKPEKMDAILTLLQNEQIEYRRNRILLNLIDALNSGSFTRYQMEKVLDLVWETRNLPERIKMLEELVPHMPEILEDVLVEACTTQSEESRRYALQKLTSNLLGLPAPDAYKTWVKSVRLLSKYPRARLAMNSQFLIEIALKFGAASTPKGIYDAVQEVTTWWP